MYVYVLHTRVGPEAQLLAGRPMRYGSCDSIHDGHIYIYIYTYVYTTTTTTPAAAAATAMLLLLLRLLLVLLLLLLLLLIIMIYGSCDAVHDVAHATLSVRAMQARVSGATLTRPTHTHKYLMATISNTLFLAIILTQSLLP